MKINIDDLKFKFKFREGGDSETFPATMVLAIGQFEIRGFSVRKTAFKENPNGFVLFPPANRSSGGKYIKIFFTDIKEDWHKLENKVLERFEKEHTTHLSAIFGDQFIPDIPKNKSREITTDNIKF